MASRFLLAGCLLALAFRADAGKIDFDNNPINFTAPKLINAGPATVTSTTPTKTPLSDGYEISNLSYTGTRTGTGTVEIAWESDRAFTHAAAEDVVISISGNTDVSGTGGTMRLLVQGTIDGIIEVDFISDAITLPPPGGKKKVEWSKSATVKQLSAGPHKLDLHSGVAWDAGATGTTLTVTSLYGSHLNPVPETGTFVLAGLTVGALVLYRVRPRRIRR